MVFESELGHSNLDLIDWLLLVAEVGQLIQAFLYLRLNPVTEGLNATKVLLIPHKLLLGGPVEELQVQEGLVELGVEDELYRVVSSCDRLDVPLDISALLQLFYIIDVIDDGEAQECDDRAEEEPANSP